MPLPPEPTRNDAQDRANGLGTKGHRIEIRPQRTDGSDAAQPKAWTTVQAECLLAGFKADIIDGDGGQLMMAASRQAFTRHFRTPAAASPCLQSGAGRQVWVNSGD